MQHTNTSLGALALWASTLVLAGPSVALAAPQWLHEKQSVVIDAPADRVWEVVGAFGDMTWVPAVKASNATENNVPGSHRTLDLGAAKMTETLVSYDAARHTYTYQIDETDQNHGVAPVSDATATISATPQGKKTLLTWDAKFHRLDHSDHPRQAGNDAAAAKQISTVFHIGLAGAQQRAEKQ